MDVIVTEIKIVIRVRSGIKSQAESL